MTITFRKFAGDADTQAMAALAATNPTANLHLIDLPYRFSSWALDEVENIGLWVDGEDRLAAWTVMQTPFWTIDYVYHPNTEVQIHSTILNWADERARHVLDKPSGRPVWF